MPAHGRVWELDGLRYAGPLEVGELPDPQATGGAWTDIVRPALHRRMQRLQRNDHIRYNLLAIVEDQYERASDRLELLKREMRCIERRLDEGSEAWREKVGSTIQARRIFARRVGVRSSMCVR